MRTPSRLLAAFPLLLTACAGGPPKNVNDGCAIFEEKDDWYESAHDSYKKWGVPVRVRLAIIYQESGFQDDAKPPRRKLLWVIPRTRPSSAYGYDQVKDSTWNWYREHRQSLGRPGGFRGRYGLHRLVRGHNPP